jgi:DUF3016 family protein
MAIARRLVLPIVAVVLCAASAQAATIVRLDHPERYTDTKLNGPGSIKAYLEQLGATLDPSLTLKITVIHIDQAGRDPLYRSGRFQVRVMRGDTWPSIRLRYVLARSKKVIASGEEQIDDTFYRQATRPSSDPLRYEKVMLRDWFDMRFGAYRRKPGG